MKQNLKTLGTFTIQLQNETFPQLHLLSRGPGEVLEE